MDAVRVSGIRLFPDPANKTMQEQAVKIYDVQEPEAVGNPFFPMLVGMIFFLVSILVYPSTYFRDGASPITLVYLISVQGRMKCAGWKIGQYLTGLKILTCVGRTQTISKVTLG